MTVARSFVRKPRPRATLALQRGDALAFRLPNDKCASTGCPFVYLGDFARSSSRDSKRNVRTRVDNFIFKILIVCLLLSIFKVKLLLHVCRMSYYDTIFQIDILDFLKTLKTGVGTLVRTECHVSHKYRFNIISFITSVFFSTFFLLS